MSDPKYWILRAAKEFPELHEQDDYQEPPAAVYTFDITSDGDPAAAGITSYSNRVRVTVDHDPGGEPSGEDSFVEYLGECLAKWFDGGRVWFDEARVIDEDEEEAGT